MFCPMARHELFSTRLVPAVLTSSYVWAYPALRQHAPSSVSATGETVAVQPSATALALGGPVAPERRAPGRSLLARARPRHAALGFVLALSAVLNTRSL